MTMPVPNQPHAGHPLGNVVSEWHAGMAARIAYTILFLLFPGGLGAALAFAGHSDSAPVGFGLMTFSALLIVFVWWQQSGVRVTIFTGGLERSGRFGRTQLRWEQLHSYQIVIPQAHYG